MYELIILLHVACCSQTPSYQGHSRSLAKPRDRPQWLAVDARSLSTCSGQTGSLLTFSGGHLTFPIMFQPPNLPFAVPKGKRETRSERSFTPDLSGMPDFGEICPLAGQPRALVPTGRILTSVSQSPQPQLSSSSSWAFSSTARHTEHFHLPHLVPKPPPSVSLPWLIILIDKILLFMLFEISRLCCLPSLPQKLSGTRLFWPAKEEELSRFSHRWYRGPSLSLCSSTLQFLYFLFSNLGVSDTV